MTPHSLSPRDTRPADRPPPRDPPAAGKPQSMSPSKAEGAGKAAPKAGAPDKPTSEAEAAFKALVDEASGQKMQGETGTALQPEAPAGDVVKAEKDETGTGEESTEKKLGESATPTLAPLLAQPQQPVPPAPMPARDQSAPREILKEQKTGAANNVSGIEARAIKDTTAPQEPKDGKAHTAAKAHTDPFAALLQDTQKPNETAPLPSTPAMTRSLDPLPPAPPLPATPPLPIVALPATIAIKALEGSNQFQIRLDPEDLGRIDVSLEIKTDGSIRAAIAADNPDALQLIVREARSLEQAFDQAGFRRDDQALSFSLSDQQQSSDQRQSRTPQQSQTMTRFFVEGDGELPPNLIAYQQTTNGRLDVRI